MWESKYRARDMWPLTGSGGGLYNLDFVLSDEAQAWDLWMQWRSSPNALELQRFWPQ